MVNRRRRCAWLTAEVDAKTPSTIVSPLSEADDRSNWSWNEEDLLFEEKELALANHSKTRAKSKVLVVVGLGLDNVRLINLMA
ncbi:hypothetical protein ACFFUS_10470 [Vibrio gallaecicus]|uniref:hypothetical protein n=1 Tax=Vibrio gallaecicus TaxID=552386 RepID=UPI0010C969B8|nr:hypothetical protein [Vibrio gallaecicus]MDN3616777.1 hypothetical protein [Vibrio gallaecicus]